MNIIPGVRMKKTQQKTRFRKRNQKTENRSKKSEDRKQSLEIRKKGNDNGYDPAGCAPVPSCNKVKDKGHASHCREDRQDRILVC